MHRLVVAITERVTRTSYILRAAAIYGASANRTGQSLKDLVYAREYNNIHRLTHVI